LEGHTIIAIVMEAMMVMAANAIKEVGNLSSCCVLLNLGHDLSFQSPKKLEATLIVDTIVLLALILQETMMALHLVHHTITA
jgi:predicted permease